MKKRLIVLANCALAIFLIGTTAFAAEFAVDTTVDAVDIDLTDGACGTEAGNCSLRAAIMQANATPGADIINLTAINDPAAPIVLSIEGVDEIIGDADPGSQAPCSASITANAAVGDLDITEDLEIFGAGPGLTVIEWLNQSIDDPNVGDRVFHVQAEAGVTINLVRIADMMIRRGSVGVPNTTDATNPYNCEVSGNPGSVLAWQFKRVGGGIAVGPGAAVFLFDEAAHGPGGDEGGGGAPDDPGGDEGEGGVTAVEFERIALINNQAGSDGGAVLAAAEMTIIDSVLSGNMSAANGGAIYIDSASTIRGTLIGTSSTDVPYATGAIPVALVSTPNMAENGGGIFDTGSHTTNIHASAINGNQAIGGGGIAARSLIVVNINNSTVSGNVGSDVGGGITTNGTVNLRNVTIANNVATTDAPGGGAGLNSFGSGSYTFYNTILSNNVVAGGEVAREANCGCSGGTAICPTGRMVSTGYNINDEEVDSCSLSLPLNDMPATDPLLLPLTNNGGLTETHGLPSQVLGAAVTSPAIDSAHDLRCPNNDQRGSLRPDDGDGDGTYVCDVGAFELFVPRADLHINNVVVPDQVDKGASFTALVEIHNDNANTAAPGVTFTATPDTLTGMLIANAEPSVGTCEIAANVVTCAIGEMAIGAIETVGLTLTAVEQGTYGMESVVAAGDGVVDPLPGNNTVPSSIFVLGNADIALTMDPLPVTVDQGATVTLSYTVVNNGEDEASTARLGMVVPAGTSFVAADSTLGDCSENAGEIVCAIGTLAVAETAVIGIQLSADVSGDLEFTAVAVADQNDPDASNNSATSTTTAIPNADLALSGSGPASIFVDSDFNVSVTVTNNGPQDATNVLATLQLPANASFVSSADCVVNVGALECAAASLTAGQSVTFSITMRADTVGTESLQGAVTADETDPVLDNNSGSVSLAINARPKKSGGCVYDPDGSHDPTLPLLLLLATIGLIVRQRHDV